MEKNLEKMTAEINLKENAVYVVKDGHPTKIVSKEHGEDTIIWKNGKVLDIVRTQRFRIEGQEQIR